MCQASLPTVVVLPVPLTPTAMITVGLLTRSIRPSPTVAVSASSSIRRSLSASPPSSPSAEASCSSCPTTAAVVGAPTSAMISASSRRSQVCSSRVANSVAWISLPSAWRVRDMLSRRRRKSPLRDGCSCCSPASSRDSAVMNRSLQSRGTSGATIAAAAQATSATSSIAGSCPVSNSRWREMTLETPSWPIETPYSQSAASIVRFWWVMTMNWARPQ